MWNPPIVLSAEEQTIAARTRKARKFFVFLRACRHALLEADLQHTLTESSSSGSGGHEPVEAGLLALATLVQASCHVGDRDAVELTVMDKRWQMVLDGLGAEQPPCSQGTLCNLRMRRIAHNLEKTLLDRTGAWAETTGGFGARHRRTVLDSTPLLGASRVEETLHLLGHALRQAVGRKAHGLDTSAEAVAADAGLTLLGHRSLKAALARAWGEPSARERALGLVLEEVGRWQRWLEQHPTLATQAPPRKEVMATIAQMITQDTAPDPEGEPGGRRIKPHVAPDRRISSADKDLRHGRTSSSNTCNGCKEHCAVDVDSTVTREVVVRPAKEPEHAVVEVLAAELAKAPGLVQLDVDLGDMASPRMAQGAEQGVSSIARPWPQRGPLFPKQAFTLDLARMQGTCPGGQCASRWSQAGRPSVQPRRAMRAPCARCTKATHGHGRSLSIREDEQCQQKLRAKMKTQRGRASRRKRTAVAHAISHQLAHQGRRARSKG